MIFISEPWIFQCDTESVLSPLSSDYSFHLNSEDKHDPELPLHRGRAHGGTLVLWKKNLDKFVSVIETNTSRILPIIIDIPGYVISAHICIYLPQANLETQFVDHLSKLEETIEEIEDKFSDIPIFIRGDANASVPVRSANKRDELFKFFLERLELNAINTNHKTYHHFVGNGASDSSIDVIIQKPHKDASEKIDTILLVIVS